MADDANPTSAVLTARVPQRWRVALAEWRRPFVIVTVLVIGLLGWQWLETRAKLQEMQGELARRLGEGDMVAKEGRLLAKENQDNLQELTGKVGGLEARLAEMQGQQQVLDATYQELLRSRDERLQTEIEQTVSLAAQQLSVAGNVSAALIALQGADARLARAGQPQFLPLRKLIIRDIDRLKTLPQADVPGISLKLESVVASIDSMPLANAQRPKVETLTKVQHSPTDVGFWRELGADFWNEMKQLIRVERMDYPTPALLSPSQEFFLRENLKLHLVNARLSLLQRDGKGFREDLKQAHEALDSYFDARAHVVQSAAQTLKSLSAIEVSEDLPNLAETLAYLRNLKVSRDKVVTK